MPKLYNTQSGPHPLALADGTSLSLSPRRWTSVTEVQAQSSSVLDAMRKGYVLRQEDAPVETTEREDTVEAPAPVTQNVSEFSSSERPTHPEGPASLRAGLVRLEETNGTPAAEVAVSEAVPAEEPPVASANPPWSDKEIAPDASPSRRGTRR